MADQFNAEAGAGRVMPYVFTAESMFFTPGRGRYWTQILFSAGKKNRSASIDLMQ